VRFNEGLFQNQQIDLDNNAYFGCTFTRCRIVYRGADYVELRSNTFRDCDWHFDGPAGATLALLWQLYHDCGQEIVEQTFAMIRTAEGPPRSDGA
jgi:hypothetical protein